MVVVARKIELLLCRSNSTWVVRALELVELISLFQQANFALALSHTRTQPHSQPGTLALSHTRTYTSRTARNNGARTFMHHHHSNCNSCNTAITFKKPFEGMSPNLPAAQHAKRRLRRQHSTAHSWTFNHSSCNRRFTYSTLSFEDPTMLLLKVMLLLLLALLHAQLSCRICVASSLRVSPRRHADRHLCIPYKTTSQ